MNNLKAKHTWTRRNCIGKGSFGVVSLAVDYVHQSARPLPFAVKSVENKSGEFLTCLENEIRILKSFSSPYIVKYLGDDVTFESNSSNSCNWTNSSNSSNLSVYRNLHMEYMPGGTVADAAKRGEGCANVREYTRCITAALSYIHARNVVHCDVKGANVLIGDGFGGDGGYGTAKLADFGSAVELKGPVAVTVTGARGSPLWMAPEVVRGEYIGPESDVWSLGCTVIEIVTGKPAWQDRGADTLRQIGYSDELPEIPTTVPDDLRDFLTNCLKRERSERWSCDQLLQHPFLLSCSSPSPPQMFINGWNSSPRCVFDWSDCSDSVTSSVDVYQPCMTSSDAKQRIGKLASNSGVNWESEGWEVVRHVTDETTSDYCTDDEASISVTDETTSDCCTGEEANASVRESRRANWEYDESNAGCNRRNKSTTSEARCTSVDSAGIKSYVVRHVTDETMSDCCSDVEASVRVKESVRVNWEFDESNTGYNGGKESTTSEAWSTSVDSVGIKNYVWIEKMCAIIVMFALNVMLHIHYTQWLTSTPSLLRINHIRLQINKLRELK